MLYDHFFSLIHTEMLWYIAALVAILAGSRAQQQEINKKQPEQEETAPVQQPGPLSYYGGFQGQLPLQYDVRFLEPHQVQHPLPNLGFAAEKQIFPRSVPHAFNQSINN